MVFNVHAGHNPSGMVAHGAVGLLDESKENRVVKNLVIEKLKSLGHTVYDCTVDDGTSQNDVLNKIVNKCNAHSVDYDISIHFNAGVNDYAGNGATTGVECWVYPYGGAGDKADHICEAIAKLGFRNRGVKSTKELYFLRATNAKAILVECCFVDDADDARLYNAEKMATAIVKGLTGKEVTTSVPAKIDAVYAVKTGTRTWSDVKNTEDYAGVENLAVTDLKVGFSDGKQKYRVHVLGGGWLPWVTGASWTDFNNGYAGEGKEIDAIQIVHTGGRKAKYRVSTFGSTSYLPEVVNDADYAGVFGKRIDKVQVYVE